MFPSQFLAEENVWIQAWWTQSLSEQPLLDFLKFINFILHAVIPDHIGIFQKWSYKGRVNNP